VKHPFFSADFCCAFESFELEIHEQTITAKEKKKTKQNKSARLRQRKQTNCVPAQACDHL
jgi:hypothetical protein